MNNKGYFFAILTAIIWGFAPIAEKAGLSAKTDPYIGVAIRTIAILIISISGLTITGKLQGISSIPLRDMIFISIGGLLAGFLGQLTYYAALKNSGEVSVVTSIAAMYPLVTLIISIIFLNEPITFKKVIGVIFILLGINILK